MAGFKKSQPGLRFSGEKITADEQDEYNVYNIVNPGTAALWWGTAPVSGTSDVQAFVIVNAIPDYPRNVLFQIGATGSLGTITGTAILNGKDQFGSVITETLSFANGTNQGTVVGTKVFAQFTNGTCKYGTNSVTGTPKLGFVVGTNCLFGLPVKIGGTADVVLLSHVAGTGAVTVNGGTVGGFVNVGMHAVRPAATITGTEAINVWVVSSYNPENIPVVAALKQV